MSSKCENVLPDRSGDEATNSGRIRGGRWRHNSHEAMDWESAFHNFLDRAVRRFRLERPACSVEGVFPASYRLLVAPWRAARDLLSLEAAADRGREVADLHPQLPDGARHELRIYCIKEHTLDELMPVLQNLGLRVVDQMRFDVTVGAERRFIRNFIVEPTTKGAGSLQASKKALLQLLDVLLSGRAEDDSLNRLTLLAGLNWKEIDLLRAYCNYYLQLGGRFDRNRIYQSLVNNVDVAGLLYRYFKARFEPSGEAGERYDAELDVLTSIRLQLIEGFDKVADVNDDRLLRDLFNLIDATLRTNIYLRGRRDDDPIAFKMNSLGVINMPSPKPMVEIYVHSRSMEGVHLRGARVSRGGIRWSDRVEDFRAEILDLMQTQMVKNALIVAQGAKGGFVVKISGGTPSENYRIAKDAYADFIRGLLDLTDNLAGSQVIHPAELVTYDDADPYLVIAADKGTAGWSDDANEIAKSYGFWLGDAFATGGLNGYHHKQLGITARGAWICVRRHFLELGRNIDEQPFSVVGVGSMDGDVFGNGMLHTSNIRLLAAFSSHHIFLDPAPDLHLSFGERKRLFETPNSTWQDYNQTLISKGGGVFRRDDKDICLSAEARAWLGVRTHSIDGEGLIRLLLTAPVDLLWMGGVGTYVKASFETNESVGDRVNDGARVDAIQLRARVVGEGANLAFTHQARVEYALNGGRINADAVDNSAGVDLSDHEVNLKILLGLSEGPQPDRSEGERNRLLAALTEDVCASVLRNNYRQSLCLSLECERCGEDAKPFMDLADQLENAGFLDRTIDAFPLHKEVSSRARKQLTRPELATLMAHSKLALKRTALESPDFLRAEWTLDLLAAYFPEAVRARYADRLTEHSLAWEIVATMICNKVVDQAGASFLLIGESLAPTTLLAAVGIYLAFDRILEGDRWRESILALDGKMTASLQYEYLLQLENALAHLCRWAIQHGRRLLPRDEEVEMWRAYLREYLDQFSENGEFAELTFIAPEASRQLFLTRLRDFPILVELAQASHESMHVIAELSEEIANMLGLRQIVTLLGNVKPRDAWEQRLQSALEDRLRAAPARIVSMQLRKGSRTLGSLFAELGMESRVSCLQRLRAELCESGPTTLTPFAAFVAELDTLIDAGVTALDAALGAG